MTALVRRRGRGRAPAISVIIPTRNRPTLLDAALDSLETQTFRDFEVLVVNDGGDSVSHVVDRHRKQFPVTLLELMHQSGPSAARNAGIEHAAGTHIAFLDDDDIFLPDHLAAAATELERTGSDFVYLGAAVSDVRLSGLPADCESRPRKDYPFDADFLLVANYMHTGAVVVRNFQNSDVRFDETLSHCEDWDMWLTLTNSLNYRVSFSEALTTVYHQVTETEGLVSQGQATVPSPFSVIRKHLYARWPTDHCLVNAYRDFLLALDASCNDRVGSGQQIPLHFFDRALRSMYFSFRRGKEPDYSLIPHLLQDRVS